MKRRFYICSDCKGPHRPLKTYRRYLEGMHLHVHAHKVVCDDTMNGDEKMKADERANERRRTLNRAFQQVQEMENYHLWEKAELKRI